MKNSSEQRFESSTHSGSRGAWRMLLIAFAAMAGTLFTFGNLYAQSANYDNFGTEFYVAFGPNEGGEGYDPTLDVMDLYITSHVVAHGQVQVPALNFFQTFTTIPGQITTIELPNGNNNKPTVEITDDQKILSGMAVHITSDSEIAVFGMNHKQYSSDAFMALPTRVLGTEYRTMNYPSSNNGGDILPGMFLVVGVADSTHVAITLNAQSSTGTAANTPFTITLNAGEVYLVEGTQSIKNDLTGSLIESDQPVAVFSGHHRTAIPDTALNVSQTPSRDHLVEQLPPVSAWGDSALVVPYATSALPDLVRIVCSEDSTQLTINGNVIPQTYNAGQFYEITHLAGVTSIQASKPIEVGQFMHTSLGSLTDPRMPAYGDPALALVFPVEQFTTAYTIISIINPDAFTGNFVNIVADQSAVSSMTIDGSPINPSEFHNIPNTRFAYAQHPLVQGTHNLTGSSPFGVTVYALGPVDSYSYVGGTLLKTITPLQTVGLTIDFGERVIGPQDLINPPNYDYPDGTFDTMVYIQNISQDIVNIYSFPRRIGDTDRFHVIGTVPLSGAPNGVAPPLAIAPLKTDSFKIEFWPHELNRRMHTQITANTDHLRAYVVDVYGEATEDEMGIFADTNKTITIDTLDFGIFTNQDAQADSEVYIGNAGPAPMSVNSVSVTTHSADAATPGGAFSQIGISYQGAAQTVPFTVATAPAPSARISVAFTPTLQNPGIYSDSLIVTSTTSTHIVVLIGHVDKINALMPGVDTVTWGTTTVCNDSQFNIPIANPNPLPVTLTSATINGVNASDFSLSTPTPIVIPSGGDTVVQVLFSPTANGVRTAEAVLNFNLPRNAKPDTVNLSGIGDKPVLAFAAAQNIHSYIEDNSFLMPIFARTDLTPYAADGYHLYVNYDSVNLQLEDVIQAGTLTPSGYFSIIQSNPPGRDTINFQEIGESSSIGPTPISGGGPTDQTPLIYLKFQPILSGAEDPQDASALTFQKGFPIDYSIIFDDVAIAYQCVDHVFDSGYAVVGPGCGPVYLEQQPFIPDAMMLGTPTPNPANSVISIPYDVAAVSAASASGQPANGNASTTSVTIDLIDPSGAIAATLVDGQIAPGDYSVSLDPSKLSSGVYMVRMRAPGYFRIRNLVIQK